MCCECVYMCVCVCVCVCLCAFVLHRLAATLVATSGPIGLIEICVEKSWATGINRRKQGPTLHVTYLYITYDFHHHRLHLICIITKCFLILATHSFAYCHTGQFVLVCLAHGALKVINWLIDWLSRSMNACCHYFSHCRTKMQHSAILP